MSHGVTVLTESSAYRLGQDEDVARWRWCGSSGSSLLPTVAAVWLGSGGGDGMISGEDRFAERGRVREKCPRTALPMAVC